MHAHHGRAFALLPLPAILVTAVADLNETEAALRHFLGDNASTQREKLACLERDWTNRLAALDDEDLTVCLRLIQRKIKSKKLSVAKERLVSLLRRPAGDTEDSTGRRITPRADDYTGRDANSFNLELEELIANAPRSKENQLVYRDWLEEQGFVDDGKVELGELGNWKDALSEEKWQWGFLRSCVVHNRRGRNGITLRRALECLLDSPGAGRFAERLGVRLGYDPLSHKEACQVIGSQPRYGLQRLDIRGTSSFDDGSTCIEASGLWRGLPMLQELRISGGMMSLGEIKLPELRKCTIFAQNGLDAAVAMSLAKATWPKIESLRVHFGYSSQGATRDSNVVVPILQSQEMPQLRELAITGCDFTDALCQELSKSRLLAQLKKLDLSEGTMGAEGAQIILANEQDFAHLDSLNIQENFVPQLLLESLDGVCPDVSLCDQRNEQADLARRVEERYEAVFE